MRFREYRQDAGLSNLSGEIPRAQILSRAISFLIAVALCMT